MAKFKEVNCVHPRRLYKNENISAGARNFGEKTEIMPEK